MKPGTPSETAVLVARGIAYQAAHPEHRDLVDARAAEITRQLLTEAGTKFANASSAFVRAIVTAQERVTVRGLTLHYVLRKRLIEKLVREAIDLTFGQLIVIGGGLDTLAARIAVL